MECRYCDQRYVEHGFSIHCFKLNRFLCRDTSKASEYLFITLQKFPLFYSQYWCFAFYRRTSVSVVKFDFDAILFSVWINLRISTDHFLPSDLLYYWSRNTEIVFLRTESVFEHCILYKFYFRILNLFRKSL